VCDDLASRGRRLDPALQELTLNVSTDEILSAERDYAYADLYAMLGNRNTYAWLTPHAAVVPEGESVVSFWEQKHRSYGFSFRADGEQLSALARSPEHLFEICDIVLQLLAASVVHSVHLNNWRSLRGAFINASALAYLMERCQSLKVLSLGYLEMDEDHCRVLGTYSRPGLEIVLNSCKTTTAEAIALAEVLGRNQGPTKLDWCEIDTVVLANGLRGNSRLKILKARISTSREVGNREVLAIAGALKDNRGLVDLDLRHSYSVTDEAWDAVCDSLETHPTVEVLNFSTTILLTMTAPALNSRIQALLDMMKVNMSIHTIRLHDYHSKHELFQGLVIPYLDTNRFRPRVRAIQKTLPIAYRAKVPGQALLAARTDSNQFWMILSGNAEVAFPSTTTPAANLPTTAAVMLL
jgi:hypothetical protein